MAPSDRHGRDGALCALALAGVLALAGGVRGVRADCQNVTFCDSYSPSERAGLTILLQTPTNSGNLTPPVVQSPDGPVPEGLTMTMAWLTEPYIFGFQMIDDGVGLGWFACVIADRDDDDDGFDDGLDGDDVKAICKQTFPKDESYKDGIGPLSYTLILDLEEEDEGEETCFVQRVMASGVADPIDESGTQGPYTWWNKKCDSASGTTDNGGDRRMLLKRARM